MSEKAARIGKMFRAWTPADGPFFPVLVVTVIFSATFLARVAFFGSLPRAEELPSPNAASAKGTQFCARIVSLAPSITEVLFALGFGDQIVGVSEYTRYPPEAIGKPRIGGYINPNYEAIVRLDPTLVVLLGEHWGARKALEELGLRTLLVNHKTVEGILDSMRRLGAACGKERQAAEVVSRIEERVQSIQERTRGLPRPRVMISVGRNFSGENLVDVYVSGRDGFYNELLTLAGGVNVYEGETAKLPVLSREGLLHLNPEVIIDMIGDKVNNHIGDEEVLRLWRSVPGIEAVRRGRVYVFHQDYAVIPGPRFVLLLEDLARTLHPEAFRKDSLSFLLPSPHIDSPLPTRGRQSLSSSLTEVEDRPFFSPSPLETVSQSTVRPSTGYPVSG
ncbi:MAG: ABC transporter substrate-binding protein [Candidatus Tectomicrobia bacterium]|uniref:ABC transporter substrate-binding protein n=1 Tax=Tectimicrobiota bacterium TaxID=2528274 RepID=A0A932GPJ2_UNCTE|nr:ABC transporter substrate-binding protein [Candidatus Tectomicrobia bacterium]